MTAKKPRIYKVMCDECGRINPRDFNDEDFDVPVELAREGWQRGEGRDLCPEHAVRTALVADLASPERKP